MKSETEKLLDLFGLSIDELRREFVAQAVIAAAGGKIVGRIRLQKIIFLLDQMGLESGFTYTYHHYGPYSEELARAIDSAKIFNIIDEKFEHRLSDGAQYSVFVAMDFKDKSVLSKICRNSNIRRSLEIISRYNSTILELASTIVWLKNYENVGSWKVEVAARKGPKVENGRLEKAEQLLSQIGMG